MTNTFGVQARGPVCAVRAWDAAERYLTFEEFGKVVREPMYSPLLNCSEWEVLLLYFLFIYLSRVLHCLLACVHISSVHSRLIDGLAGSITARVPWTRWQKRAPGSNCNFTISGRGQAKSLHILFREGTACTPSTNWLPLFSCRYLCLSLRAPSFSATDKTELIVWYPIDATCHLPGFEEGGGALELVARKRQEHLMFHLVVCRSKVEHTRIAGWLLAWGSETMQTCRKRFKFCSRGGMLRV